MIALLVVGGPATLHESKNGSFCKSLSHRLPGWYAQNQFIDGISGHWCWISEGFPVARIMCVFTPVAVHRFLTHVCVQGGLFLGTDLVECFA